MAKFRKKPVVIEAVKFTGQNCIEVLLFMRCPDAGNQELHSTDCPVIHTSEGDMIASPGDWIIRGVAGEFYPCKPDIFAVIYDQVADATPLTGPSGGEVGRAQPSFDPTRIMG